MPRTTSKQRKGRIHCSSSHGTGDIPDPNIPTQSEHQIIDAVPRLIIRKYKPAARTN